ncbi:hypothetical protein Dimus_024304, partial [Dionaea muscipula]
DQADPQITLRSPGTSDSWTLKLQDSQEYPQTTLEPVGPTAPDNHRTPIEYLGTRDALDRTRYALDHPRPYKLIGILGTTRNPRDPRNPPGFRGVPEWSDWSQGCLEVLGFGGSEWS